ncbi:hypothetical protein [Yinghuangia seranimata]|uniref:hypothetical protein n=1 Tax=Yinghuangia seranimata TaxID=408067 RepID=UPI00248D2B82|nr:hypothetical protein [Yinghuangia seranimata]MDI2129138.1 hypothetical protein [Yinghuangia seranimata]
MKRLLVQACSADPETAGRALVDLTRHLFPDYEVNASAPLLVPFLLRLAATPATPCRVRALRLAAAVARHGDYGATRDSFLVTDRPGWRFSCDGYLMTWTIEASRLAITADTDLLLALLHDPAPDVRTAAADTLATVIDHADLVTAALRARLATEQVPAVRAALVLACAELARSHRGPDTADWLGALWPDPDQPADTRVAAALGWLCLTDDPVPDSLRAVVDSFVVADTEKVLDEVPWFARHHGLLSTVRQLVHGLRFAYPVPPLPTTPSTPPGDDLPCWWPDDDLPPPF